jgi:hypothetical protein
MQMRKCANAVILKVVGELYIERPVFPCQPVNLLTFQLAPGNK